MMTYKDFSDIKIFIPEVIALLYLIGELCYKNTISLECSLGVSYKINIS